jgi:uncharacterized protein YndB with AHSA1/START domain
VAGSEELSGPDVILVHRLLKNRVVEAIGHAGYAFYTDAVVAAMGLEPARLRMRQHAEEVEGSGDVGGWIADLHDRWTEERERRRVKVGRDEAVGVFVYDVPAPRALTWSFLTEPELRARWTPGVKRVEEASPDGRRGSGTRNHCVHGGNAVTLEEILDWRPFDYYTIEVKPPMPLLRPIRITHELEDSPDGTRVTESTAAGPGFGQRALVRLLGRVMAKRFSEGEAALRMALAAAQAEPAAAAGPGGAPDVRES